MTKKPSVESFFQPDFEVEGNNGGNYLKLIHLKDNLVAVEVGHECVVTVRKIVPIEILTVLLSSVGDWKDIELDWSSGFNEQLRSQIETLPRACDLYRYIDDK